MRQPTFSRSRRHTRSYRLARTGIAVAIVVVVAAIIANLFGGKAEKVLPIANVSFSATASGFGDARNPGASAVAKEKQAIVEVLNDWFQKGFVDPKDFAEGDFGAVKDHFSKEARAEFDKQVATLTIGDARAEVKRVDPTVQRANMSFFFEGGKTPRFATVRIVFSASATMKEEKAPALGIVVSGLFTFEKQGDEWRVKYWDKAKQTQNSVPPSAAPTT